MRKVTKQAIEAFMAGRNFKSGNTEVFNGHNITFLTLHGNEIAMRNADGTIWVSSAGWETTTTKERLNGIPNVSVYQSKGVWYLNGEKWLDTHKWTCINPIMSKHGFGYMQDQGAC